MGIGLLRRTSRVVRNRKPQTLKVILYRRGDPGEKGKSKRLRNIFDLR